jgi:hypothetical protein
MNSSPTEEIATELMARHHITRAQVVQYRYKAWRYSNLADAVVQAERDAASSPPRREP